MLTTRTGTLLVFLYYHLAPVIAGKFTSNLFQAGDQLWCDSLPIPGPPPTTDCLNAIAMLSRGSEANPNGRGCAGFASAALLNLANFPALFNSGDCFVRALVASINASPGSKGQSMAGTYLYYQWWPRVTQATIEIVSQCFEKHRERNALH